MNFSNYIIILLLCLFISSLIYLYKKKEGFVSIPKQLSVDINNLQLIYYLINGSFYGNFTISQPNFNTQNIKTTNPDFYAFLNNSKNNILEQTNNVITQLLDNPTFYMVDTNGNITDTFCFVMSNHFLLMGKIISIQNAFAQDVKYSNCTNIIINLEEVVIRLDIS
jgi:hypothetical protein